MEAVYHALREAGETLDTPRRMKPICVDQVPSKIHDCFLPDCRQPSDGGGAAAVPEAARARDDALRDQPGGLRPPLLRRQPPPHRRPLHPQGVDPRTSHLQVSRVRPVSEVTTGKVVCVLEACELEPNFFTFCLAAFKARLTSKTQEFCHN